MTGTATVGTIYGLVDPRDGKPRYIGQTRQRLAVRSRGKYAAGEGPVASVSVTPGTVGDTVLPRPLDTLDLQRLLRRSPVSACPLRGSAADRVASRPVSRHHGAYAGSGFPC